MGLGLTLIQYDLIFTWLHLQRPYFQVRSHRYWGLGLERIFLDTIEFTTGSVRKGSTHSFPLWVSQAHLGLFF